MSLVLYSGFWLGLRSWHAAAARHEDTEDIRLAVDFLQRYLSKAYPLLRREDTGQRLQFEGDEQRLRFVTDMAPHLGIGGLYTVVLELVENGDEHELAATRTLLHPDLDPSEAESGRFKQRAVLARELDKVRFAYFGTPGNSNSSGDKAADQWQDEWTDAQRLPVLVSIEVTPRVGAPWPTVVLPLRIDTVRHDTITTVRQDGLQLTSPVVKGDFSLQP